MADLDRELNATSPVQIVGNDSLYKAFVDSNGRVSVNANITFPEANYYSSYLLNGSASNMNVNGATVNQNFSYTADTTVKYLEYITFYISDNSNFDETDFGALTQLTNGLLITYRSKGQVKTFANLQNNVDIFTIFREDGFSDVDTGLLGTSRLYTGSIKLQQRITLDPGQGDYVRATVRDNLTDLVQLRIRVRVWELNG